jgi:signal transduction histidine kinase
MDIGRFLSEHRDTVIARWEERVRPMLADDPELTDDQLRDSLNVFLDEVIAALVAGRGQLAAEQRSPIARDHGQQRQLLARRIDAVVREYWLLLECVFELAREHGESVCDPAFAELAGLLFVGAAEATDAYAERQDAQQRRAAFEFFAFAAHELRNPLSSARMAWSLIVRENRLDPRHVEIVTRSLDRVASLVDDVITHSRVASMPLGLPLRRERIAVARVVEEVRVESAFDADAKGIRLEIGDLTGLELDGDHRLLRSALTNLLRNAIKFTHEGGSVTVRGGREQGRVFVEVEDRCGGLPVERAEKIFEAFMQSSEDRSGFGLGLAITKQAVEAMGGTIGVENQPGVGCTFRIDLPEPTLR